MKAALVKLVEKLRPKSAVRSGDFSPPYFNEIGVVVRVGSCQVGHINYYVHVLRQEHMSR